MKFRSFPSKNQLRIVYRSYTSFRTDFFEQISIQVSPKNSLFFRLMKSPIGFVLSSFLKESVEVPASDKEFIGILKDNRAILFELVNSKPIKVWRKDENSGNWIDEPYFGETLISKYSLHEFEQKKQLIQSALKEHWNSLNTPQRELVHGDLTHFNILIKPDKSFVFIDEKSHSNSILFDFFYFYAYLKTCVTRCKTVPPSDKVKIIQMLATIISETCEYADEALAQNDLSAISLPKTIDIYGANIDSLLTDFSQIILTNNTEAINN